MKQWILIITGIVLLTAVLVGYRILGDQSSPENTGVDRSYDTDIPGARVSTNTPGVPGADVNPVAGSNGKSRVDPTDQGAPTEQSETYLLPRGDLGRVTGAPRSESENRVLTVRRAQALNQSPSKILGPPGSPMLGLAPEAGSRGNAGLAPEAFLRPIGSLAPEAGTPNIPVLDPESTSSDFLKDIPEIINRGGSSPDSAAGNGSDAGTAPEISGSSQLGPAPESSGAGETGPGPE